MMFSLDGCALLCACTEGLLVVGWEPARRLDMVPASWGHVYDLATAHTQLVILLFMSHLRTVMVLLIDQYILIVHIKKY